jgi:hypothetical protein
MSLIHIDSYRFAASGGGGGATDPDFSSVSLLLHGDGVNGGNNTTFVDSSTNNHAITVYGNAQQVSASPYGSGGSGAFDGSGDYLDIPSSSDWAFGTGNFTVEAWIYATSLFNYAVITGNLANNSTTSWAFTVMADGVVRLQNWNTVVVATGVGAISLNTWTHVAVTRNNDKNRIFINGNNLSESTASVNFSLINNLGIGKVPGIAATFNGYIDDLRITKGAALYTSNFTPPTAPLTADANTSLLLHFDNVDIIDSSSTPKAITAVGNAQISTAQSKFGGSSIVFDNGGDYLTPASSADLILGSTWTVECWWYLNAAGAGTTRNALLLSGSLVGVSGSLGIYQEAGAFLNVRAGVATSDVRSSNSSIVALEWQHIAISTLDNVATIYINGVQNGSGPINGPVTASVSRIGSIGSIDYDTNGYIDDFRITKGVARYTSNFTPPTAPFPDA